MSLATSNDPPVSTTLSRFADQLHQIEISLATLAKSAGKHREIVAHVARSVGSAFSITRSASVVIYSVEFHRRDVVKQKKAAAAGQ